MRNNHTRLTVDIEETDILPLLMAAARCISWKRDADRFTEENKTQLKAAIERRINELLHSKFPSTNFNTLIQDISRLIEIYINPQDKIDLKGFCNYTVLYRTFHIIKDNLDEKRRQQSLNLRKPASTHRPTPSAAFFGPGNVHEITPATGITAVPVPPEDNSPSPAKKT